MTRPFILSLLFIAVFPAFADITFDTPRSGWRQSGSNEQFTQDVHYPANMVNTPKGTAESAMIRGRIAERKKSSAGRKPATLIVNGTPMPLHVNEDGSFSRPYAFGSGSNSIEVRDEFSGTRKRLQFYDVSTTKKQSKLRVVLSWDSDGTDVDLHVITPSGQHSWYGHRVIEGGGALDVDVTSGYGPEIFAHPAPEKGLYQVYVNYYGSGYGSSELTIAQVAILSNENTPHEKRQIFQVPLRRVGDLQLVSSFVYP